MEIPPSIVLGVAAFLIPLAAAQNFTDMKVEKIASGLQFTEGPAWSRDGFLLFSDCVTNKLHKFVPGVGGSDYASIPGGPNGNAYDLEGRLYTCEFHSRRVTRTSKKGAVEVLASKFEGKRLNAPNDIVVRRDGHVFFTDPAFGDQQDHRELDFFGVFHIAPKGELEALAKWKTRPNGITLSPNGKVLYVADSDARLIRAYDLNKSGAASNERIFVDNISGVPDGIRTDEKGNLYVAAKFVYVYSDDAKLIGTIELGETPSNLAFGDGDLEGLYVTARTFVFRVRIGVKGALQY
ncbi:MAG: SMP-30/gluconolactonase/LRE family protein [Bryobacteraceae bacterium]